MKRISNTTQNHHKWGGVVNWQGIFQYGRIDENQDGLYITPEISTEYFTFSDNWRMESQSEGRFWLRKNPSREIDGDKWVYKGLAAGSPYKITFEQRNMAVVNINYCIDLNAAKEIFANHIINMRGLLLKFKPKFIREVSIDGKQLKMTKGWASGGNSWTEIKLDTLQGPIFIKNKSGFTGEWKHTDQLLEKAGVYTILLLSRGNNSDKMNFDLEVKIPEKNALILDFIKFTRAHNQSQWFEVKPDLSMHYSDISRSVLDPPAGKYGFVTIRNGHFYFEKSDKPVRFYGVNLNHAAKFPDKKTAEILAKRLAAMGCNLVRLHNPDHKKPAFGLWDRKELPDKHKNFDKEKLDRFDYLIYQLKKHGIYIHFDHVVGIRFGKKDGIDDYSKVPTGLKGIAFLYNDKQIIEYQKNFMRKLWLHVNPYTGLAYKDEPAIATTEIINESDLYTHGNLSKFPGKHRNYLFELWHQYSKKRKLGNIDYIDASHAYKKEVDYFKYKVMKKYFSIMYKYLRSLGVRIPITGTNWFKGNMMIIKSEEDMDYIANHTYIYPDIIKRNDKKIFGWKYLNMNPMDEESRPGYLSMCRIYGKPLVNNEWGVKELPERELLKIWQSVIMAAQGHDGSYQFLFALQKLINEKIDSTPVPDFKYFQFGQDPGMAAFFPVLSLMFIRGDLKSPKTEYVYHLKESEIFGQNGPEMATRKVCEKKLKGIGACAFYSRAFISFNPTPAKTQNNSGTIHIADDKNHDAFPNQNKYPAINETGEIVHYWKEGYMLVKSKRTKIVLGYPGGKGNLDLEDDVSVKITNIPFASVAISSLTKKPVTSSKRLMVTVLSYVEFKGERFDQDWKEVVCEPRNIYESNLPILCQPVYGEVIIPTSMHNPKVVWKKEHGEIGGTADYSIKDGKIVLKLDKPTLVYEIYENK